VPGAKVGDSLTTPSGQPRRLSLPDGSVIFLNGDSSGRVDGVGSLILTKGEVFVHTGKIGPLVVKTGKREVTASQADFSVRAAKEAVLVARGSVRVRGMERPLRAGELVQGNAIVAAPRLSHALAWTRDLLGADHSRLVPASSYAGGKLAAVDPNGQEAKISLRKYHVDVHVEDGFARTTIDQTYFNHESSQLEGTFYFPLPADASLSRLAMYVNGALMEGGMAERSYAAQVYETIRYARRDPALLEWLDGTTFKMRVFPIEPRQEKRIILSYTQKLPVLYGQVQYRFPAGHSLPAGAEWSFHARVKNSAGFGWACPSHALEAIKERNDLVLQGKEKNVPLDRDMVLTLIDPAPEWARVARPHFSTTDHEGSRYFMVRYEPVLPAGPAQGAERGKRHWVFLMESSGDRDPLLARAQIDVIEGILSHAEPTDTFVVLAAGTRASAHAKPRAATEENVRAAVSFLEKSHLIGALDLGNALKTAASFSREPPASAYLVHVGSGIPAMGERRQNALIQSIPKGTRYVGIGVGRRWNRAFMKAAAESTGGYFTQINPDEPIAWRAFETYSALFTPRLLNVQVLDPAGTTKYLAFTTMAGQGEEICALTRLPDKTLPETVLIKGTLDGKPWEQVVPVQNERVGANYLPRTWAKLEIDRLLAKDAAKHKDRIVELSKAMYVMTPFTSLLVLENEDMYVQYKVDRGRKDHWAMYPCPPKISVVYEPLPGEVDPKAVKAGKKLPAMQVINTIAVRDGPSMAEGISFGPPALSKIPYLSRAIRRIHTHMWRNPDLRFVANYQPEGFGVTDDEMGTPLSRPALHFPDPVPRPRPMGQIYIVGNNLAKDYVIRRATGLYPGQALTLPAREAMVPGRDPLAEINYAVDRKAEVSVPGIVSPLEPVGIAKGVPPVNLPAPAGLIQKQPQTFAFWVGMFNGGHSPTPIRSSQDGGNPFIYGRPAITVEDRFFFDLLSYAPGMNTSDADIEAVLEAEALPIPGIRRGKIDAEARRHLDKARSFGWMAVTFPAEGKQAGFTVTFDGRGRHVYERVLPPGIRERVVCDGATLWHLYPQLRVGAKRTASRFHRAEFGGMVPWVVPAAEELARGADLQVVGERTVVIVPHQAHRKDAPSAKRKQEGVQVHLMFGEDGRLSERKVVRVPKGEVVYRQILEADGTVRVLDGKGKELAVHKLQLRAAEAPSLKADIKDLVVLPLPYRTAEHVRKALKIENKNVGELSFKEALPLFGAAVGAGNASEALQVFQQVYRAREQKQLGFYVLLAACGQNLDAQNADVLSEHMDEPLAQYLALHSSPVLRKHASQWAVKSVTWNEGFLQYLGATHALLQRWQNEKILKGDPARMKAEKERAFDYLRTHQNGFAWALLCLMQDRADKDQGLHAELAEAYARFADKPGLGYAARYEQARCFFKAGKKGQARKLFGDLYDDTFKKGALPDIDADFRLALLGQGKGDSWNARMGGTAAKLIADKRRPAVLALAWQCWQLGDMPLANHLAGLGLAGLKEKERVPMLLAGIDFFRETGQWVEADRILEGLLKEDKLTQRPGLWRLALDLAEKRDRNARALECLEKALDREYAQLGEVSKDPQGSKTRPGAWVLDLEKVRGDYGKLLGQYQTLADAMVTLKIQPPPGFLAKVVRTADRWRAIDPEGTKACQAAAGILQRLGVGEMAWDYLTTPIALKPAESDPWRGLAGTLQRQGELSLADRAYRAAFETEPTNAQILWDRAQNLKRLGKTVEARTLFRQIADGTWQPRFQGLQTQARLETGE
jgi:hypothetical protein